MLILQNITKVFNANTVNEKRALDNLNLHVKPGDFITIIGSNGAGKSTLFNAISGSFITDSGSIILDGKDVTLQAEHIRAKEIGRLFQDPLRGTAPHMTIEENLALACGHGGWLSIVSKSDKDLFRSKLELLDMGLENKMKQPMGLLSGGQRQAVTLLMATIHPPKLLLLDEHTAALDPAAAEKVLSITNSVVKENKLTCLMITHNMESALSLGNRTLMMRNGSVIFDTEGEERSHLTVNDLLNKFKEVTGKNLDNDRMLLQE